MNKKPNVVEIVLPTPSISRCNISSASIELLEEWREQISTEIARRYDNGEEEE